MSYAIGDRVVFQDQDWTIEAENRRGTFNLVSGQARWENIPAHMLARSSDAIRIDIQAPAGVVVTVNGKVLR